MSVQERQKLKCLLETAPIGTVILSSWLANIGISPQLQRRYRSSHWLTSIGTGAMVRSGDRVGWEGAIYALQNQAGMKVHPGGKTALGMQGKAHFLVLARETVSLFGTLEERLPKWFASTEWNATLDYHRTSLLPVDIGLVEIDLGTFSIKASAPARAMMECLHLANSAEALLEAKEIMDGLNNLRPKQVQSLLEACGSVKVKRLFLYLADLSDHAWRKHVDRSMIDLGSGTRSLVKEGTYVREYDMMVPRGLTKDAEPSL